jgi:hypothetical protein
MARPMTSIEERIRWAFAGHEETLELLREFLEDKSDAEDFVILACARIDALANLAAEGKTQAERFTKFVRTYSGARRTLDLVSVPDLYRFLARHYDFLPFSLETPGRIQTYELEEELPFIRFLASANELPLTADGVGRFLRWFSVVVQQRYRTTASQRRSKPSLESRGAFLTHLQNSASGRRNDLYANVCMRLEPLVKQFSVGPILYREFRSGAIHEHGFVLDEDRFFTETGLYFTTTRYLVDPGTRYLGVEFSAKWLLSLLEESLVNYTARLISTKKLPFPLFIQIADVMSEAEYLADEPGDDDVPKFVPFALGR